MFMVFFLITSVEGERDPPFLRVLFPFFSLSTPPRAVFFPKAHSFGGLGFGEGSAWDSPQEKKGIFFKNVSQKNVDF